MKSYDLAFSDGKRCRCLIPEPAETEAEDIASVSGIFTAPGYLVSVQRYIPPIPAKLPWRRDNAAGCWRLARFELRKACGEFALAWPGGSMTGTKDQVRQAVEDNWADGC